MINAESTPAMANYSIELVGSTDLADLLPLMRANCDFCTISPNDQALLAVATALIDDPEHEGLQLIARDPAGRAGPGTLEQ